MDFISNETWNIKTLKTILPDPIIQHIINIEIGAHEQEGYAIWNMTGDGLYDNKSAWTNIRLSRSKDGSMNNLWHKAVPFKISFLTWRLCRGILQFNEAMTRFGNNINTNSDCLCCRTPSHDSMQHTFIEGEATNHIWKCIRAPSESDIKFY